MSELRRRSGGDEELRDEHFGVVYEGPTGPRSSRMLNKSVVLVTKSTIEMERVGANPWLACITCGCWWCFFTDATTRIFTFDEISEISYDKRYNAIYIKTGEKSGFSCLSSKSLVVDCPLGKCLGALTYDGRTGLISLRLQMATSPPKSSTRR